MNMCQRKAVAQVILPHVKSPVLHAKKVQNRADWMECPRSHGSRIMSVFTDHTNNNSFKPPTNPAR